MFLKHDIVSDSILDRNCNDYRAAFAKCTFMLKLMLCHGLELKISSMRGYINCFWSTQHYYRVYET